MILDTEHVRVLAALQHVNDFRFSLGFPSAAGIPLIANHVDAPTGPTHAALFTLNGLGYVQHSAWGLWRITDKGRRALLNTARTDGYRS